MRFLWPAMLGLLVAVPALIVLYVRLIARRRALALRYASLATLGEAPGATGAFGALRRHFPAILLLAGLSAMIFAVARPQAMIALPSRTDAIILAMDVSGSMRATDVAPNRITAAQNAAKAFVADQPGQVRIGVVAIAATASLVQSPTDKREDINRAIDRFQLQRGTALGSGLVISLATLLPDAAIDVEKILTGRSSRNWARDPARQAEIDSFKPVPPGSNRSVAIVLLSDGESNTGPDLLEAAKIAAERGVRVYTVGVGTQEGATLTTDGWSMRVRLDEDSLKKIATMTRGEYFRAGNALELKKIYRDLSFRLAMGKGRATEVTAIFVAIGAVLAMLGALLSMLRSNRIL
ncbi:MAG: VWA domain-containing protein [Betaproteobacteria bacterium]|nr:VWA domain-containing protein [Betaproteobacteria bacterium]